MALEWRRFELPNREIFNSDEDYFDAVSLLVCESCGMRFTTGELYGMFPLSTEPVAAKIVEVRLVHDKCYKQEQQQQRKR